MALLLAVAAPAWAEETGTASVPPIGAGGSYLVAVDNTGSETIHDFIFATGANLATNVVPSPACSAGTVPFTDSIKCTTTLAPGTSTQMCYTGHPPVEAAPDAWVFFDQGHTEGLSQLPAVASCPLPGFNSSGGGGGSEGGGNPGGGGGSGGGGSTQQPTAPPTTAPVKCKKGFKKKKVHGKAKCVKAKKKHRH